VKEEPSLQRSDTVAGTYPDHRGNHQPGVPAVMGFAIGPGPMGRTVNSTHPTDPFLQAPSDLMLRLHHPFRRISFVVTRGKPMQLGDGLRIGVLVSEKADISALAIHEINKR
jgi:hypothetical protein